MIDVRDAYIAGNGKIRFIAKVDAVSPSSRTEGIVTIHEAGSPETPAFYAVQFYVSAELGNQGVLSNFSFQISIPIVGAKEHAPYLAVESEAARQIAPILRSVADQIEQQVSGFDRRRSENTID